MKNIIIKYTFNNVPNESVIFNVYNDTIEKLGKIYDHLNIKHSIENNVITIIQDFKNIEQINALIDIPKCFDVRSMIMSDFEIMEYVEKLKQTL